MLLFQKYFIDVITLKSFLSDFLIMRYEMFVKLIAKIFNIFKDNCVCFIVDSTE